MLNVEFHCERVYPFDFFMYNRNLCTLYYLLIYYLYCAFLVNMSLNPETKIIFIITEEKLILLGNLEKIQHRWNCSCHQKCSEAFSRLSLVFLL